MWSNARKKEYSTLPKVGFLLISKLINEQFSIVSINHDRPEVLKTGQHTFGYQFNITIVIWSFNIAFIGINIDLAISKVKPY